ncbi:MAG: dipeptidase, partial [Phycisphaerales bacterium]|nr:dipeptidase [Phycisphaerales bacterium]
MQRWFDGHLDLAFLAEQGRDLTTGTGGPLQPAAVTFPNLRSANIQAAFATIFANTNDTAKQQLATYRQWHHQGLINITTPGAPRGSVVGDPPLKVTLLLEGATPLNRIEDFDSFYHAGVRIVSLTWAEGNIWAGGDRSGGGVTPLGRELITRLNQLNIIHDVSHLSERAFWTVMELAKTPIIASHSNCRSLLPNAQYPERHLSDQQIKTLANSGGIIGSNLFSPFLVNASENRRATITDILHHIRHMEQITGKRNFIALGSDMDGGFTPNQLPSDLTAPTHLEHLAEALANDGWTEQDLDRFCWGNWTRIVKN